MSVEPIYAILFCFFFNDTATTEIYTLSLHDALPISTTLTPSSGAWPGVPMESCWPRSEEHTSELQSRVDLVCRLLLDKKKKSRIQCYHRINNHQKSNSTPITQFN